MSLCQSVALPVSEGETFGGWFCCRSTLLDVDFSSAFGHAFTDGFEGGFPCHCGEGGEDQDSNHFEDDCHEDRFVKGQFRCCGSEGPDHNECEWEGEDCADGYEGAGEFRADEFETNAACSEECGRGEPGGDYQEKEQRVEDVG